MNPAYSQTNPMARVISLPNFCLLSTGAFTSLLGDQFALIATPWLVLQLTGDPLMLGTVLALEGIPRAAFILFGGAITNRLSPRPSSRSPGYRPAPPKRCWDAPWLC
jgi:hypothetical protein